MSSTESKPSRAGVYLVGALAVIALVAGCASIMHGTQQDIGISSSPTGASVTVDNQLFGNTPAIVKLSRKDNHILKLTLAGHQPFEATITRSVSGWVWGNVLFGGLIGLAVDAITGGLYKLTPEQIAGTMVKEGVGFHLEENTLYVAVVLHPDPTWEKVGTLKLTASE